MSGLARAGWLGYGALAAALALVALAAWGGAIARDGPVLYGEGAVAHAALLDRAFAEYRGGGATFTAANYPPLYYALAGIGDPFRTGRILSVGATLAVAALVAWRARQAGRLVPAALALGWLALAPLAIWGPVVKPDLVALALAVAAVLGLETRRPGAAAVLLVLATLAKPTEVVTLAALLAWLALRDRQAATRFAAAAALAGGVAAALLVPYGYGELWTHVVTWNALGWSGEPAVELALLALATFGAALGAAVLGRALRGPIGAYAAAGVVIVALGGREGATINYLLDLAAASSLALAAIAPRLARAPFYPTAALLQLVVGLAVLDPLALLPARTVTTGAWAAPERIAAAREALASDEQVLAEDSGLLVATGHRVAVDDLFLWSRLAARGTIDPGPLLTEVRAARFTAILSEAELGAIAAAPAFERARWDPALLEAIGGRYRLERRLPGGLFLYRPR